MSYFALIREAGPGWSGKGIAEQPAVEEHSRFMAGLAAEGFILFAGPLAGSDNDRLRVLLIAEAADEAEIHGRLADDPWAKSEQLLTTSVEAWNVFVGAERLSAPQPIPR
jgi:uncharacterized protein YciI